MNPAMWTTPTDACVHQTAGASGPDRITKNVYDAAGQLLQVRNAFGTPLEQAYATYRYTPNGKRDVVVDANGNRAEMRYDGFDRQDRWTFPGTSPLSESQRSAFTAATPEAAIAMSLAPNPSDYEEYTYDANGNRLSLRKRDGRTLTYTYDALNRLTAKVVQDGCAPIQGSAGSAAPCPPPWATRDVYYGYDLLGRQLYARFEGGAVSNEGITNSYDGLGRLTSSVQLMDGTSRLLDYAYDANGNRTRLTFGGQSFSYSYDGLDRMKGIDTGIAQGPGALATIAYNNAGQRQGLSLGGGDAMAYGYDGVSRLTSLGHSFTGTTANNVTLGFTYNPASQIITETRNNDDYVWRGDYNVTRTYAANGLNQYTSAGPASFTYDANGNLISDGSVTYSYDVENRIIGASGAKTATLKYDPLGRLYEVSGGSGTTRFLYDTGMGAAAGVDALLAEYDAITGTLNRRYVHGPGLDEPLVWYEGSDLNTPRYLHANHQGSVIGIANGAGQNIGALTYDPYGIPGTTNYGRFQYTGQIWLSELGLYHYKARAYSPTLGRFLQTDPIGYDDQINLYGYVGNDPVGGRDPDGTETVYNLPGEKIIIVPVNNRSDLPNSTVLSAFKVNGVDSDGMRIRTIPVLQSVGYDVITVSTDSKLNNKSPNGNERSHTSNIGGRQVFLAPGSTKAVVNHDAKHPLGAGDQYRGGVDANGNLIKGGPKPNTTDSIMNSNHSTKLNQQSINEISKRASSPSNPYNTQIKCVGGTIMDCK